MIARSTDKPWTAHEQMSGYASLWAEHQLLPIEARLSAKDAAFIAAARNKWEEDIKAEKVALDALEEIRNDIRSSVRSIARATEAIITIIERAEEQP